MGPSSCHAGSCILAGLGAASRCAVVCRGGGGPFSLERACGLRYPAGAGRPAEVGWLVRLGVGLWSAIACRGGGGPFSLEWACGPQWLAGLAEACRAGGGRAATSSIGRVRAARTVRRGVVRNAALWQRRLLSWEQRTKFRELSCSVREASSTRFVCCTIG